MNIVINYILSQYAHPIYYKIILLTISSHIDMYKLES